MARGVVKVKKKVAAKRKAAPKKKVAPKKRAAAKRRAPVKKKAAPKKRAPARRRAPAKKKAAPRKKPAPKKKAPPKPPTHDVVRVRELDPQAKCGPGTSVQWLVRVDEKVDGRLQSHLVFFDQHGWYCDHGPACFAVAHARRHVGQR